MELDLNILRPQERLALRLRLLYEQAGFRQYRMGRKIFKSNSMGFLLVGRRPIDGVQYTPILYHSKALIR